MRPTPEQRFWTKVAPENEDGCRLWTAGKDASGYGQFSFGRGVNRKAHRVAYEWLVGPIPEGLQLDHLCHTRACVNPEHLEPVTLEENVRRGNARRKLTEVCRNGHPYRDDNMYVWKGQRYCRTCRTTWQRERR